VDDLGEVPGRWGHHQSFEDRFVGKPCFWHSVTLPSPIFVTECRNSSNVRVAMTETNATITEPVSPDPSTVPTGPDEVLTEELLVEEISIDGMCGVY
jgi:mycofactocin precursor